MQAQAYAGWTHLLVQDTSVLLSTGVGTGRISTWLTIPDDSVTLCSVFRSNSQSSTKAGKVQDQGILLTFSMLQHLSCLQELDFSTNSS